MAGNRMPCLDAGQAGAMAERRPRTRPVVLDTDHFDTDHFAHDGDPAGFGKAVRAFLAGLG